MVLILIMENEVHYLMSQKQLNRYVVLDNLIQGLISTADAACVLGLSERQILRLKKGVLEQGTSLALGRICGDIALLVL